MRRCILVVLAVATTVTAGGGSSFAFRNPFAAKKGPAPVQLPPAEWAALKQENAQRLAGEGIPGATTRPSQGGMGQFFGFLEFTFVTFPKQIFNFYTGNTPGKYARM